MKMLHYDLHVKRPNANKMLTVIMLSRAMVQRSVTSESAISESLSSVISESSATKKAGSVSKNHEYELEQHEQVQVERRVEEQVEAQQVARQLVDDRPVDHLDDQQVTVSMESFHEMRLTRTVVDHVPHVECEKAVVFLLTVSDERPVSYLKHQQYIHTKNSIRSVVTCISCESIICTSNQGQLNSLIRFQLLLPDLRHIVHSSKRGNSVLNV